MVEQEHAQFLHTVQNYCIKFCIELTFLVTCHRYYGKIHFCFFLVLLFRNVCSMFTSFLPPSQNSFPSYSALVRFSLFIYYPLSPSPPLPGHINIHLPLPPFQTRRQNINECVYSHLCIEENGGYTQIPLYSSSGLNFTAANRVFS